MFTKITSNGLIHGPAPPPDSFTLPSRHPFNVPPLARSVRARKEHLLRSRSNPRHAPLPARRACRARAHGLGSWPLACTGRPLPHLWVARPRQQWQRQPPNCRTSRERARMEAGSHTGVFKGRTDRRVLIVSPTSRAAGLAETIVVVVDALALAVWRLRGAVGRTDMALRKGGASDASERMGVRRRSWKRILACGRGHSIWTGAVGRRVDGTLT